MESPTLEKSAKIDNNVAHLEKTDGATNTPDAVYSYEDIDEVPELHLRTYVALAALFLLNFTQLIALTGPPFLLAYIGADLNATATQTWVPNALSLVQAVGGPIIAFGSDVFQARRGFLLIPLTLAFIGSAIIPNSTSIGRVIAGQILIGCEMATVPLAYSIPSELVPRRWRPLAQSLINVGAQTAAGIAPFIGAAFIERNGVGGWRNYYWVQTGLIGVTIVTLFFGYRPPKRKPMYDHLSFMQKLGKMDLPGALLLTAGLTLLLVGLGLGGNPAPWSDKNVLGTLIAGCVVLLGFVIWEWKGTEIGILHHGLFSMNRNMAMLIGLMFLEGYLAFAWIVFLPAYVTAVFTTDAMQSALHFFPYEFAVVPATVIYGFVASKTRRIKEPLACGYLLWVIAFALMTTVQPDQGRNLYGYATLSGLAFGGPLVLIIALSQLSTPHKLIATGTAVLTSARAVGATVATAIYAAALNQRIASLLPVRVADAAAAAGLPTTSIPSFVGALATNQTEALGQVPGVTPAIIGAGVQALVGALCDSFHVIYIIGIPFAAIGVIGSLLLKNVQKEMHYRVDAPIEELHARHRGHTESA